MVWGGVLQEVGRTRYILRKADDPLDIWLINDVPVPELGDVIPVQWVGDDPTFGPKVGPTIDDTMLTTGCWLENASDAKKAHDTLIASPGALRVARSQTKSAATYQKLIAGGSVEGGFQVVAYRRKSRRPRGRTRSSWQARPMALKHGWRRGSGRTWPSSRCSKPSPAQPRRRGVLVLPIV